ncbi:MAG: NmrA/HSCARG family protein [Anaerolineales bacterium]|jgi:uncharacterized protein YbjT (DUF2867 family)
MDNKQKVLIFGATGNMGGAATRELLRRGWHVRAVTRNPISPKALALAELGAEVVQGDMEDRASLETAFDGMKRVFSVQNWTKSGVEGEVRQGKLVAEVAHSSEVKHLAYGSAGTGDDHTGIPHFDSKLEVEGYMRQLGLPFTVVRPAPFMELLTEKEFYPALVAWGIEPKILGLDTPLPWVAVRDIGIAVANIFEAPQTWIGHEVELFGDVRTLGECRELFVAVDGKKPFGLPLPRWVFSKMASDEFIKMWEWMIDYLAELGDQGLWETVESSRKLCPKMLDMESWLKLVRNTKNEDLPLTTDTHLGAAS